MKIKYLTLTLCSFVLFSCAEKAEKSDTTVKNPSETQVVMHTNVGDITLKLYNETPEHRDNFLKLVKEHRYDSLLFHRVIENFMVQAGDPESKTAADSIALGNGDLEYTIPAEFHPDRFHKRGVLGAARNGNIARASSAMQFYIVQGRVYTDSTLTIAQGRINKWLAENEVVHNSANKEWATIWAEFASENRELPQDSVRMFRQRIDSLAEVKLKKDTLYAIPSEQWEIYKSLGGAAHLDQNYTVFGEVMSGMPVIDNIARVETNEMDRPLKNIRILKTEIIQ